MAIQKKYGEKSEKCKVIFKIPKEIGKKYKKAYLVGDFNEWNTQASPMNKNKKDGSFSLSVELKKNNEYQFRYLLDEEKWINDETADKIVPTYFQDSENSLILV